MSFRVIIFPLAALCGFAGCQSSTPLTSRNATTAGIIFGGKRIRQNIDDRWAYLDSLKEKANDLSQRVRNELNRVEQARHDWRLAARDEAGSRAGREDAERRLEAKAREGEQLKNRIGQISNEIGSLERERESAVVENEVSERRYKELKAKLATEEKGVQLYENMNKDDIHRASEDSLRHR